MSKVPTTEHVSSPDLSHAVAAGEQETFAERQARLRDYQQRINALSREIMTMRQALRQIIRDPLETHHLSAMQAELAAKEAELSLVEIESAHVRLRYVEGNIPAAETAYQAAAQHTRDLERQLGALRAQWAEANATMRTAYGDLQSLQNNAARLRAQLDQIADQKGW